MRDVTLNIAIAAILAAGTVSAGTITFGFETSEAKWYGTTSTNISRSGDRSAEFSISSTTYYTAGSWVLTPSLLTLGQIQSIDYWIYIASPQVQPSLLSAPAPSGLQGPFSAQSPYPMIYAHPPGGNDALAVMYNDPSVPYDLWVKRTVNSGTLFHVEQNAQGLMNPSNITLGNIQSSMWDQSTSWASLPVKTLALGMGLAGYNGVPLTAYVDDITITFNTADPTTTPEPATLAITALACVALAVLRAKSILVR